jgi:hypothetical protein
MVRPSRLDESCLVIVGENGDGLIFGEAETLFAWLVAAAVKVERLCKPALATAADTTEGLRAAREALAITRLTKAGDPFPDITVGFIGGVEANRYADAIEADAAAAAGEFDGRHVAHVETFLAELESAAS